MRPEPLKIHLNIEVETTNLDTFSDAVCVTLSDTRKDWRFQTGQEAAKVANCASKLLWESVCCAASQSDDAITSRVRIEIQCPECSGGSLAKELHRAGIDATPAAVSQRRAELAPVVFREVFTGFNAACVDSGTYCGYRVLAVDGTTINLPYNPNAESFLHVETHPKGGYNALHATPFFDISSQTYVDCAIQPESNKDEIGALLEMLQNNDFTQKTLIVADRGFESYNLIAHLLEKSNTDFLIRVKQNHGAMREIARLPMLELDCDIAFTITTTQTNEDKQKRHIFLQIPRKSKEGAKTRRGRWDFPSPYPMCLRICRFQLDTGEFETIATSLPRSFALQDIKEIYRLRCCVCKCC